MTRANWPAFLAVILVAIFLTGCAARFGPIVEGATTEGQATADAAADGIFAAMCAATIGSIGRRKNPQEQRAAALLCWPEVLGEKKLEPVPEVTPLEPQ